MKTKKIAVMAMFVAIQIVVSRLLSVTTPITKISFTFIPLAVTGYLMGVKISMLIAIIADLIGATLLPSGPYFPGFTVSAAVTGAAWGMLKGKDKPWLWVIGISFFHFAFVSLLLNSTWIYMMGGKAFSAIIGPRVLKSAIMLPLEIIINGSLITALQRQKFGEKLINGL
ncbi:folate family ECF transporter S component [Erysipelothrix aquatica]|uniref:folate family ECF transporter S component n=1 Tax=Erysipelothrix aquatica TaxID=2683714 RepID=UPI00135866D8|nr:folate family ECF transporter S component [Erysipelothrix aquatica]